jgi:serpin B
VRRIVVIIVSLVAICAALAVVLVAANHHATSAAAAPVNPLRGDPTAATDARLLAAPLDRFGLALLAREAQTTSGNVVISPLSIHDVLSMILNGAQGRTAAEMRHTLGLEALSLPATDQAWADLIAAAQAGDHPAVQIADSLWLRDGVAFAPAFLAAGRDYFAASTSPLPTDPTKAADAINGWVDARTAGLIKQIVDPSYFNDATILTVVNTVHVKAAWQTPFDPSRTEPAPFTLADGTTVQVPTMSDEFSGPVAQTPAYDAVALATKGPVTAWVIVPRNGQTPDSLLTLLAARGLDSLYRAARPEPVMLDLPKLHTTFSAPDLKPELEALGMVSAFSPQDAELQGIVAPGTAGRVYIQRVVHKAVLNVNENGVEAAAATAALVGLSAAPYAPLTIRADRPFLMLLTDKSTSAPLFMALIRDPRE